MAERKLVMGYWDCPFCGEKGIPGTSRNCPGCQSPRGKDTVFYMKKDVTYLTEEEAKTKGQGADWQCEYCGAFNSALVNVCSGCGSTRDETNKDYFEVRKEQEQRTEEHEEEIRQVTGEPGKPASSKKSAAGSSGSGRLRKKTLIILAAVVLALFGIIFSLIPKTRTIHVDEKQWDTVVSVEKYQEVSESDWSLPSGGDLLYTKDEIHHYDQVLTGYETVTYESYEVVGSHTEYDYEDNGDGTFSENAYTVDDYGYVTRTREEPVYESVPVYQTKYYYTIWRWLEDRTENLSGSDNEPVYAEPELAEDERIGDTTVTYTVTGTRKDKTKTYSLSEELYLQITPGEDIKVQVSAGNTITAIK